MKYSSRIYAAALLAAYRPGHTERAHAKNFLSLLRRNGDLAKLPEIVRQYERIFFAAEGITHIAVVSARPLGESIERALKEQWGGRCIVEYTTAPDIVGGVIIRINNELVIDASVKRRLGKLFAKS